MKLIRLTTTTTDGLFDNTFNQDIKINPNSKIALQNIITEVKEGKIVIDGNNDTIYFQTESGEQREANLTHTTYGKNDYTSLLEDIENSFRRKLKLSGNDLGYGIDTFISKYKAEINFYKPEFFNWTDTFWGATSNVSDASGIISCPSGAPTTTTTNKYYCVYPLVQGCGVFRVRIGHLVDNGSGLEQNGFAVGLSVVSYRDWENKASMTNLERTYEISCNRPAENYEFRTVGDDPADAGFTPEKVADTTKSENDIIEFSTEEGALVGRVYQDTGGVQEVFRDDEYGNDEERMIGTMEINAYQTVYPYLIIFGDADDVEIDEIKQTIQETALSSDIKSSIVKNENSALLTHGNPPPAIVYDTNAVNSINFVGSIDLPEYLGFKKTYYEIIGEDPTYQGELTYQSALLNYSLVIESLNIPLESYENMKNGRMNTLCVIPDEYDSHKLTNLTSYEPNTLNFININNIEPLILRNIRMRILNVALEAVKTKGTSVLTLLVKDENE